MTDSPQDIPQALLQALNSVVLGQRDRLELIVTAFVAGGHVLIEDRPGVGKTLLARSMARALDLPFQRVQCTADMLPADILGGLVFVPGQTEPRFRHGPVFTNILLADELNRTPPRTQSALLECMAEQQISLDGETRPLPDPFFVIATQNPQPQAGTYTLPDSQLDRFLLRVRLGYPDAATEARIVASENGHASVANLAPILRGDSSGHLRALRQAAFEVRLQDDLLAWIVELARATREHPEVEVGVSPRGAQALHRACRARAVVSGRNYVVPDDVLTLAEPVYAHRLLTTSEESDAGDRLVAESVLGEILERVPSPDAA